MNEKELELLNRIQKVILESKDAEEAIIGIESIIEPRIHLLESILDEEYEETKNHTSRTGD